MANPQLVTFALADQHRSTKLAASPQYRRASHGLIMCLDALQQLQVALGDRAQLIKDASTALIVATSQGELGVTKDYLQHLGKTGAGRPLLFQNSLHNAALGFLSLEMQMKGIGLTVSNGFFSGESALDAAKILTGSGMAKHVVIVAYDVLVPEIEDIRAHLYPQGLQRTENACAALLAVSASAEDGLSEIRFPVSTSASSAMCRDANPNFYDANGLEQWCLAQQDRTSSRNLQLLKPDGSSSVLTMGRLSD